MGCAATAAAALAGRRPSLTAPQYHGGPDEGKGLASGRGLPSPNGIMSRLLTPSLDDRRISPSFCAPTSYLQSARGALASAEEEEESRLGLQRTPLAPYART